MNVTNVVIQGCAIGSLLFLLFTNEMCPLFQYVKPLLFAYDLKVVDSFSPPTKGSYISAVIQEEIDKLYEWTVWWNLSLNGDKSGFSRIGRYLNLNTAIHEHTLKPLDTDRDSGLRYSNSLNFSEHIASQVSKGTKLIEVLMIKFNNIESRLLSYRRCILPIPEYATLVNNNCSNSKMITTGCRYREYAQANWRSFRILTKHCDRKYFTSNKPLKALNIFSVATKYSLHIEVPIKKFF